MQKNVTTPELHLFLTNELSQWYPSTFVDKLGVEFSSAEQWMMWRKSVFCSDPETGAKIMATDNPREIKALGRAVANYAENADAWLVHAPVEVLAGNMMKFSQNPELWAVLDGLGDRRLAEAAHYDKIWGIGLSASDPRALDPSQWDGKNQLGEAVMATRAALRANPAQIASREPLDALLFVFKDEAGQRDLRLSARGLSQRLDCGPSELRTLLGLMGDAPMSVTMPNFAPLPMSTPASALLSMGAPAFRSKAPAP